MSKINLLELCLSPSLGGLELYMMHTSKALCSDFNLISVIQSGGQLESYFKSENQSYIGIKHKGKRSFFSARRLARIIDENRIDVIHIHWTNDLVTAVLAMMMSKSKPKLVQSRHMNMTRFKNDFYHRYLYKKMDLVLPVTSAVAQQIIKYVPESIRPRMEVLYIGSSKIESLSEEIISQYKKNIGVQDEFVVGMVGRIEEAKGQYLLIEAIEKFKHEGKRIKALFLGHAMEESYLEELKRTVVAKGLSNDIEFLGFSKNPHRFMQACDLMVLATQCETFGLVLIEAMQVGTAVIASNQCGPLEIIEDKKSGLLFEVGNSADMYEKIMYMYENEEIRLQIASEGKKRAELLFSNEKQFSKLSELLKSLVA